MRRAYSGPSLNSEPISQPETGEVEANLSNMLPLPLPGINDKESLPETAEQLFYSLCLLEDHSRIERVPCWAYGSKRFSSVLWL